jgi:predicted nucleic acid-binding protein
VVWSKKLSLKDRSCQSHESCVHRFRTTHCPSIAAVGARFQLPWYDSLIVVYSEDFQDGQQIGSITISNPFA